MASASSNKRPELRLSGNVAENFKNFELRFNDYCIQAGYRDLDKDEVTEQAEYYKSPVLEISALRSSMPDDALQVIRYTIEPQITTADKKKPWVWMQTLRIHYTGISGSTLMTSRFKFWHASQNAHESVQDWEVRVRQAGNLCEYGASADEMCRDKFVFGLKDNTTRTELLKTHLKPDKTKKEMSDVVAEAKTLEIAQQTNQLIIDNSTKAIEEQVHWTGVKKKHSDMKLKRDPNTCHWCGSNRGPHAWATCPAKGRMCTKCGGNDHFAKVCLEPARRDQPAANYRGRGSTPGRGFAPGRGRGRGRGAGGYYNPAPRQYYHPQTAQGLYAVESQQNPDENHHLQPPPQQFSGPDGTLYFSDDYEPIHAPLYCLDESETQNNTTQGTKFYAKLQTSVAGNKFHSVQFQIDTAASCNTISEKTIKEHFSDASLFRSPYLLFPYGNSKPIKPLGQVNLLCERRKQYHIVTFQVLPDYIMNNKPALLSGKDCQKMGLVHIHADEVHALETTLRVTKDAQDMKNNTSKPNDADSQFPPKRALNKNDILSHFAENFSGVGCLQPPVSFKTKPDITPVQMPIHRVPISKRSKEKAAIDRYVKAGILKKVQEPTPWCSNILCRESETKFRVCIDPSQTINKTIIRPICQMPTLNEQLHKLDKAKCFSLIDVREGFLHVPLDEESSRMTTMHTSFGRYRWTRLPFGINSAPEEFQIRLMTALEGLEGMALIADDILTFGVGDTYAEAEADHDAKIISLMERAQEKNIKFNSNKFQFKKKEIKFVGHIITADGIKADPEKVNAILQMEAPHDKASLLRFIGMINYLSPYCRNLSTIIRPLTELTKNGMVFLWSDSQKQAFAEAKSIIANAPVLQYFQLDKPVTLQVDASERGLGGVIMQPNETGQLQPVAYTSCTLTETEKRYSQIEKECLAICNAFAKFDHWLYGKPEIEVHTDHKPLETIFKKPLNKAPARLQRMLMRLQRYQFNVVYKKGTSLHIADTLSRAALPNLSTNETKFEVFRVEVSKQYPENHPQLRKETEKQLWEATRNDPILNKLQTIIQQGWPEDRQLVDPCLLPYWNYRDELTVNDGLIYKSQQTVIPSSMFQEMLCKIHNNHFGAASNIRMAKEVLFWHGMSKSIQDMCDSCTECAKYQRSCPRESMRSLPIPTLPWQIVSQDLFELNQQPYLVTVCHFSDWIEVDMLDDTLSNTVIDCTKQHFARYGIPEICHTDNGSQFISKEYNEFAKKYQFTHTKSSPYYPKGNGRAEAAVKVAKNMLKKSEDFHAAILNYRNTPQQGHTYSPVQRMMNHRTRTLLPTSNALLASKLVDSNVVHKEISAKRLSAKEIYDRQATSQHSEPSVGTYVYAKPPPTKKSQPWVYGRITDRNENRSYTVQTPNSTIRRNRIHLRPAAAPATLPPTIINVIRAPTTSTSTSSVPATTPDRTVDNVRGCVDHGVHSSIDNNLNSEQMVQERPVTTSDSTRPVRVKNLPAKYKDYHMADK